MRKVLAAVLLFGAFASAQPAKKTLPVTRKSPIAAIYHCVKGSVVLVSVYRDSGKPAVCAGVVVGKGLIVTATHVVGSAQTVQVLTVDGRSLEAGVVRWDDDSGLTLLSVSGGLKVMPFSSGEPDVGDPVIVIGHNYGFNWTVTSGIVSGLGRQIDPGGILLSGVIQTDAAINTGSSGGPLLNMRGELIGIGMAFHGAAQNLGFCVPLADVRRLLGTDNESPEMPGTPEVPAPRVEDGQDEP